MSILAKTAFLSVSPRTGLAWRLLVWRACQRAVVILAITLAASTLLQSAEAGVARPPQRPTAPAKQVTSVQIPSHFEANQGQFASEVKFVARMQAYTAWFTGKEVILTAGGGEGVSVHMRLVGSGGELVAEKPLRGTVNYLRGSDPQRWVRGVPTYERIVHRQVYPGIDVVYRFEGDELEYDLIVARGADPGRIRLHFEGATSIRGDAGGDLVLSTAAGEVRQRKPKVYQETLRGPEAVSGRWVLEPNRDAWFEVADYDRSNTLVIDPAVIYSSYMTGAEPTTATSVATATDSVSGKTVAILAGFTSATDFPTRNARQAALGGCCDGFIAKFDPFASGAASLLSATYFGGGSNDQIYAMAVDSGGNVYVTGFTDSSDFPLVNGATGIGATLVTKFSPDLQTILYSTRFGGTFLPPPTYPNSNTSAGTSIATDGSGNAYITGWTRRPDMPVVNAFQSSFPGTANNSSPYDVGGSSPFVARFNTLGIGPGSLTYSTYLNGDSKSSEGRLSEKGNGIAVDSAGMIHVVGATLALNFPIVNGFDASNDARGDSHTTGFYAKLNPANPGASQLVYSTYVGGSYTQARCSDCPSERAMAVAVDAGGNAYVTGSTFSGDFPVTSGAFQTNSMAADGGAVNAAYAMKIDPNLSGSASLVYSTFLGGLPPRGSELTPLLGGNSILRGTSILVDDAGNAYVGGIMMGDGLPWVNPATSMVDGLLQSTDQGETWVHLANPQADSEALAIDGSTSPRTLYRANWGPQGQQYRQYNPVSIYKSIDGGLSWTAIGSSGLQGRWVNALAVDPSGPTTVYALTDRGVYRSTDAGGTWVDFNGSNTALSQLSAYALTFDGIVLYLGTESGVFRFAGGTWSATGLTSTSSAIYRIDVDPTTNPHTLYVWTDATNGNLYGNPYTNSNVYKSSDQGITWVTLNPPVSVGIMGVGMFDSATSPPTLYVLALDYSLDGNLYYVFKSSDRGATWTQVTPTRGSQDLPIGTCWMIRTTSVDPTTSPSTLYAGDWICGLYRSTDEGQIWQQVSRGHAVRTVIDTGTAGPTTHAMLYLQSSDSGNGFVAKLNPTGSALLFSTPIGAINGDSNEVDSIARDSRGNLYLAANTTSGSLATVNGYQQARPSSINNWGAFLTVLGDSQVPQSPAGCSTDCSVTTAVGVPNGTLSITFPAVTGSTTSTSATLTVTPLSTADTANFSLSNNLGAFEISTTAVYAASPSNPITLCFQAVTVNDPIVFGSLTLVHIDGGVPVDITSSRDFATRTVCGEVTSFSPFILVKGALGQLQDIVRYVNDSDIKKGIQLSLDAKVDNAAKAFSSAIGHDYNSVCNLMNAFMSSVQAQVGKALSTAEAAYLIGAARQVKATVGCAP